MHACWLEIQIILPLRPTCDRLMRPRLELARRRAHAPHWQASCQLSMVVSMGMSAASALAVLSRGRYRGVYESVCTLSG